MSKVDMKELDNVFDTMRFLNDSDPVKWREQITEQLTHNDGIEELRKLAKLKATVQNFIEEYNISHEEVIYQYDNVIVNAYEFIHELVEIVGFKENEDDDNDE